MELSGSSENSELTPSPVSLVHAAWKWENFSKCRAVSVREWTVPEEFGAPWNFRDLQKRPCGYGGVFENCLRKNRNQAWDLSEEKKRFVVFWGKRWGAYHLRKNYLISWHEEEHDWGIVKWVTFQRTPAQNEDWWVSPPSWWLINFCERLPSSTGPDNRGKINSREQGMVKQKTVPGLTFSTISNGDITWISLNLQICIWISFSTSGRMRSYNQK